MAGSGVDCSWADSSTSTKWQLETDAQALWPRSGTRHAPRNADELSVIVDEMREKLPGMLTVMDPGKAPGTHRTPTVDLMTISSGRVVLTLDDDSVTELAPGDCIVQRGTMHAWANPFDEPCTITGVMLALRE